MRSCIHLLLSILLLAACRGRPAQPVATADSTEVLDSTRVVMVDTTFPVPAPGPRTDSAYRAGDYLFYGDKDLVFDFYRTGHPPAHLRSKGDTLHCDSSYTILGDLQKASASVFVKHDMPYRFEDFPARGAHRGRFAAPDFRTDRGALRYRTRIRAACAADSIGFGGYYSVAEWGCGAMCAEMALVDRRNGRVFFSPKYLPFDTADGHYGVDYRRNSRLLIVNSYLLEPEPGYVELSWRKLAYYEWTGDRFRRLPDKGFRKP